MTLETAKRIKNGRYVQGQDIRTYEKLELLNKEADAILRGGMHICEEQGDGNRKYKWIKVIPTKTDEESSIELALKKHQKKKQPRRNILPDNKAQEPNRPTFNVPPTNQDINSDENNSTSINRLAIRLKKMFHYFVKLMDGIVDE